MSDQISELQDPLGLCSLFSDLCSLPSAELENSGAEAVELVGAQAADPAEIGERCGRSKHNVAENRVAEDEEGGKACGVGLLLAPGAQPNVERGLCGIEFDGFNGGFRYSRFAYRR
jgi:hypothetical protein